MLEDLVHRVGHVPGSIIEIGSWEGRSTVALANAAHPRAVHAVDTWEGSPGEISADLASERDVYATWLANIEELTRGNVIDHRMGWREFLPLVDDVALVIIDAEHTYVEVRDNVFAFLPHLVSGGIVCGDDQHHPPIRRALAEIFDPEYLHIEASVWWWQKP